MKLNPIGDVEVRVTPRVVKQIGTWVLVAVSLIVVFLLGYNIARATSWNQVESAIVETELLKKKAEELDMKILQLTNHEILLAAERYMELGHGPTTLPMPCTVTETDTVRVKEK